MFEESGIGDEAESFLAQHEILKQFEGKIFGGGGVETLISHGNVFVNLDDVGNVLARACISLMELVLSGDQVAAVQTRALAELGMLLSNLNDQVRKENDLEV